ncbi:hypothetical protein N7527_002871 [Penicillium freii]|nr:hypothetical protein N7527_002871 [Penicillium freii]
MSSVAAGIIQKKISQRKNGRDVFRGIRQMAIEPKCSGHDFIKRLARELVFDLGGHRVYDVHAPVVGDPPPTLSHGGYGEMVVERVGERKKRRGGWGVSALLYSQAHAYVPKMDTCPYPTNDFFRPN